MKRLVWAALAAALAFAGLPAMAADVSINGAPVTPEQNFANPAYGWTGPYVGLYAGGGTNELDAAINPHVISGSTKGHTSFDGGFTAGYNWQVGNLVFGGATDFGYSSFSENGASQDWNGNLRAVAGVAYDRFLFYGTGGFAYGHGQYKSGSIDKEQLMTGWTAGAGIDWAAAEHWRLGALYLHTEVSGSSDLGSGYTLNDTVKKDAVMARALYAF